MISLLNLIKFENRITTPEGIFKNLIRENLELIRKRYRNSFSVIFGMMTQFEPSKRPTLRVLMKKMKDLLFTDVSSGNSSSLMLVERVLYDTDVAAHLVH